MLQAGNKLKMNSLLNTQRYENLLLITVFRIPNGQYYSLWSAVDSTDNSLRLLSYCALFVNFLNKITSSLYQADIVITFGKQTVS